LVVERIEFAEGEELAMEENLLEGAREACKERGALGGEMERAGALTGACFEVGITFIFGLA
jgi:hypothetical protein